MILAWSLIYKHNFSPLRCYIWNNRLIKFKKKSLFYKTWFNNNIILVSQLLNDNGTLLNYSEFLHTFGIPITPKEFAIVMDAITSGILTVLKGTGKSGCLPALDPKLTSVGKICFATTTRNNNRNIYSLFQREVTSTTNVVPYWSNFVDNLNWGNIWNLPYKYLLMNKVREVSFKIIHRYYPAKQYLLRFKLDICVNCSFCGLSPETMVHLLWQCPYTTTFLKDLSRYITDKPVSNFSLFWKNVLFGFLDNKSKKQKDIYLINLLIILGKYHIHKAKFSNSKPSLISFGKETEQYIKTIYDLKIRKLLKPFSYALFFMCLFETSLGSALD